jgi:hypothetical protein
LRARILAIVAAEPSPPRARAFLWVMVAWLVARARAAIRAMSRIARRARRRT